MVTWFNELQEHSFPLSLHSVNTGALGNLHHLQMFIRHYNYNIAARTSFLELKTVHQCTKYFFVGHIFISYMSIIIVYIFSKECGNCNPTYATVITYATLILSVFLSSPAIYPPPFQVLHPTELITKMPCPPLWDRW